MGKKNSRKQKVYKMIGCSKKTRKNYLGGSTDTPLAYTGKSDSYVLNPNPNLAYNGKGGSSTNIPINTNGMNSTYPNTGPVSNGNNTIFSNANQQKGGSCGCSLMKGGSSLMKGGSCGVCSVMKGGVRHRNYCKCSTCKRKKMRGGNPGIPYPNGLVGSGWSSQPATWPGVDGISGDRNYYPLNTYNNGDPQTSMKDVGANPPFLYMKAGNRKQKGGVLSNFITQDLINLGRQFQFGVGSAYNALAGYSAPVNPMPWKDQLPRSTPLNPALI
jgi:hypothetical protein